MRRFDADRRDQVISLEDAIRSEPTSRQLLWIDVAGEPDDQELGRLVKGFALDARTASELSQPKPSPLIALHGEYVHIRLAVQPDLARPGRPPWLDIISGHNLVITRHTEPVPFLDGLDERIEQDTTIGLLDSATFAATILNDAVTTYLQAADAIENEVDVLDTRSLREDHRRELLDDLVGVRRRISRLRRLLTDHRELFASLAGADFARVADNPDDKDVAAQFAALASRFDSAIAASESARDVLLGSFDVYMTRTAQRTNDIMKVLALTTVLLLPGSLIAGLLGMNVGMPFPKDDVTSFWVVVGVVVALAIVILVLARTRRWL